MRSRPDSLDLEIDLEAMLTDLRRLVETESPSLDVDAITRSAAVVAGVLTERLGTSPRLIESAAGPHVHWSGGGAPRVLLVGHHDTVFPLGTLALRPFAITDGRATGPGVFDMKAGIVQAIHGLAALDDRAGIEVLITADEEVGSGTSRQLIEERATACGAVLVLEPSADGGALKSARKGTGTFEIIVHGRAAHAGLEPEKGANALVEAARLVLQVADLGRADVGTTVTPTVASAGTADNVVPAEARVRVDVRVVEAGEKERVESALRALTALDQRIELEVLGGINRPPMPPTASAGLMALVERVAPGLAGVAVGGGSDGNFTAAIGVPTLDGLGAVGGGAHGDDEHVLVDTMTQRAALIAALVDAIGR